MKPSEERFGLNSQRTSVFLTSKFTAEVSQGSSHFLETSTVSMNMIEMSELIMAGYACKENI